MMSQAVLYDVLLPTCIYKYKRIWVITVFVNFKKSLEMASFVNNYKVCHGFRFTKRNDYF